MTNTDSNENGNSTNKQSKAVSAAIWIVAIGTIVGATVISTSFYWSLKCITQTVEHLEDGADLPPLPEWAPSLPPLQQFDGDTEND